MPFRVRPPPIMAALIAGSAPAVGEGFDGSGMNACLTTPGMEALAVRMVHSIQGDLDPLATPPSPAIAAGFHVDRSCSLDRSPVGHTREG